jgi:hypothetical protein
MDNGAIDPDVNGRKGHEESGPNGVTRGLGVLGVLDTGLDPPS